MGEQQEPKATIPDDWQSRSTVGLGGTLWIAVGTAEGRRVYLPSYTGETKSEVGRRIMERSYQEGYRGKLDERLANLCWEIVQVRFSEVPPNA